jgi:hypothetical protein
MMKVDSRCAAALIQQRDQQKLKSSGRQFNILNVPTTDTMTVQILSIETPNDKSKTAEVRSTKIKSKKNIAGGNGGTYSNQAVIMRDFMCFDMCCQQDRPLRVK